MSRYTYEDYEKTSKVIDVFDYDKALTLYEETTKYKHIIIEKCYELYKYYIKHKKETKKFLFNTTDKNRPFIMCILCRLLENSKFIYVLDYGSSKDEANQSFLFYDKDITSCLKDNDSETLIFFLLRKRIKILVINELFPQKSFLIKTSQLKKSELIYFKETSKFKELPEHIQFNIMIFLYSSSVCTEKIDDRLFRFDEDDNLYGIKKKVDDFISDN